MYPSSTRFVAISILLSLICHNLDAQRIVCDETCRLADAPAADEVTATPKQASSAAKQVPKGQTVKPASPAASQAATAEAPQGQAEGTVPALPQHVEPGFAVVSPVGRSAVTAIAQPGHPSGSMTAQTRKSETV